MSKEAMKLALEALESLKVTVSSRTEANVIDGVDLFPKQMAALQKALANEALGKMAENARELGLDYEPIIERVEDAVGMGHNAWDMVKPTELAKAFHEALAEESSGTEQLKMSDYEPDGMHHNKPHKCKYPKCSYPCPDLPDCRDAEQPAQQEPVSLPEKIYEFVPTPEPIKWHHPECEGQCIACLIEQVVQEAYGSQGLGYLQRHLTSPQPSKPWADECRIELVNAIHFLASDFENALGAFRGDTEARRKAEGDIAHARSIASRWNWNGTTAQPSKPLTDEQISDLWCEVSNTDFVTADTHQFARAIEAAHGIKENT